MFNVLVNSQGDLYSGSFLEAMDGNPAFPSEEAVAARQDEITEAIERLQAESNLLNDFGSVFIGISGFNEDVSAEIHKRLVKLQRRDKLFNKWAKICDYLSIFVWVFILIMILLGVLK